MNSINFEQAQAYLERIGLPEQFRAQLNEGPDCKQALGAVTALQKYHMQAVPFENMDMHYSAERALILQTDYVYDLVVNRNRGGLCPQVHQLFALLLKSFGFDAYCTGGRLNDSAGPTAPADADKARVAYGPFVHVATIVTIHGQKYLVDTNVGPSASPLPVPMVHNQPSVDVWERQRRFVFEPIPGWTTATPLWRLQIKEPSWDSWMDVIAFEENQWLPIDFKIMINGILGMGLGWFKSRIMCYRIEMDENERPTGYLMLYHDELRRGYKGKHQLLRKLYSEEERIMVLKEEFDVTISEAEARHISGTVAELKDDGFDFFGNGKL